MYKAIVFILVWYTANAQDGPLYARLVDGEAENEGRVQIINIQDWYNRFLLCDQGWDLADADVVCRMLSRPSALRATTGSYFGSHDTAVPFTVNFNVSYLATDFACAGNESHISQCPAKAWFQDYCPTGHTAGVICNGVEESEEFQLRLMGGSTPYEGRVEVSINDTWGSVCSEKYVSSLWYGESNVICRQLGLGYGLESPTDDRFGRTDGPVAISGYLDCGGGESSFAQCYFSPLDETPDQECFSNEGSYQASVVCSGPVPESRSPIRTASSGTGFVLIHHDGRWGTICNDNWTLANSEVVCRELGFRAPKEALNKYPWRGKGPIFLSGVSCKGYEETLDQCELGEWYHHDCTHAMDVSLTCACGCVGNSLAALLLSLATSICFLR